VEQIMTRRRLTLIACLVVALASFNLPAQDKPPAAAPAPPAAAAAADKPAAAAPADDADNKKLDPAHMRQLAEALGAKPGVTVGPVHTLTLPRDDLDVRTLEMGDIPVEAGLASTIRTFRCHCGKYFVIGEFCLADYESNDVIDALRKGQMQIVSVGPVLLQESPRLVMLRFQGEGHIEDLLPTFKNTVRWIGENRTKKNPLPKE
jgi:hypothetical protein